MILSGTELNRETLKERLFLRSFVYNTLKRSDGAQQT